MSASEPRTILSQLRRAGAVVQLAGGDRLHIESPRGLLTPERKKALQDLKPDLLARLAEEARIIGMSLDEFERCGHALEVRVPWLPETLWFVPRVEHVAILANEGVARGRVWTARELADLASIEGLPSDDIRAIGQLKAKFGAQIVSVQPSDDLAV